VVGAGWNDATAKEIFERLPEQAVGQIVVSGMPLVVRNIAESPLFADWSELKEYQSPVQTSFVGIPIKGETRTIGTIYDRAARWKLLSPYARRRRSLRRKVLSELLLR
jgi:Nif-specific regulatory protein